MLEPSPLKAIERVVACPIPPASVRLPAPLPEPPDDERGSYRSVIAYVLALQSWAETEMQRSAAREAWQRKHCQT